MGEIWCERGRGEALDLMFSSTGASFTLAHPEGHAGEFGFEATFRLDNGLLIYVLL